MRLKFLQINIFKGKFLDALLDFVEKEDPDIITMQEVTSGGLNLCDDKSIDLFGYLKNRLGYDGAYVSNIELINSPDTFGNAVLTKFPVSGHNVVLLHEFRPITLKEFDEGKVWPKLARYLVDLHVEVGLRTVHAMSWHGAWTPTPQDTPMTLGQAQKIADYLKSLNEPFILGCDSNALIQSKTIGLLNDVAANLLENSGVIQTTHPKVHKIAPRGFLIDFIFTSKHFRKISLEVPQVTVSDHLPVVAELEL